jgi:WD40 repeat protein
VTTVVFAPDGATITLWDPAGWSSWDAASGNRKGRDPVIGKSCERTAALPRSSDGRVVAAQCKDRLFFFDAGTGRLLGERQMPEKQTSSMYTASADGAVTAIVTAGVTNSVTLRRLPDAPATTLEIGAEIEQLSLSSSGHRLTIGTITGVEVRQLPDGKLLRTLEGRASHTLSGDGRLVAVASDRGAQIFEVESGQRVGEVAGRVSHLRFSPDAKRLIGWTNQQVITWDAATGAQQLVLKSDEFVDASVSPDGTRLATVSLDRRGEYTTSIIGVWRLP